MYYVDFYDSENPVISKIVNNNPMLVMGKNIKPPKKVTKKNHYIKQKTQKKVREPIPESINSLGDYLKNIRIKI